MRSQYVPPKRDDKGNIYIADTDNTWLSISQVCKQWRRVEGITRLSLLALDSNPIPKFLPRFPNLIEFESSTHMTNTQLEFVAKTCPHIEILNLSSRDINRVGDESGVDDVGDVGLCAISKGYVKMERVLLRGRKKVGNLGVMGMVKVLKGWSGWIWVGVLGSRMKV
ncbi:hypothetical protein Droror1_Dr00023889 [Drosera rotundifolia]